MLSAVELDAAGDIMGALKSYEESLTEATITRDEVLNLLFLYGLCWDFGFSSAHRLDMEFVRTTKDLFDRTIQLARERFGDWPDLKATELYLPWAFLGLGDDAAVEQELHALLESGASLVPVLRLFDGDAYSAERAFLLDSLQGDATQRADFIRSVLADRPY